MANERSKQEEQLTPCAKWTNDCQGKKDYDGRLISISARYWPAGGGMHIYDTAHPELGLHESVDTTIKPSANASIVLNFGEPDEYGYGDYMDLCEQEFTADTEAEVKAQVEKWAQDKFDKIRELLKDLR